MPSALTTYSVYVYRDPHFAPAGDTLITVAPLELVNLVYGLGVGSRQAALASAFGGAAVFKNEETGAFYLGIWGKRNASRFRTALRQQADIEIAKAPPPGRLTYVSTQDKPPTYRGTARPETQTAGSCDPAIQSSLA